MDKTEWKFILECLDQNVFSLNTVGGFNGVFAGHQQEISLTRTDLVKNEAVIPLYHLLLRSQESLTNLDLRSCLQSNKLDSHTMDS